MSRIYKRDETGILYEEITNLEKKQCTKNEVESEQAVMEMPITRNKCGNK